MAPRSDFAKLSYETHESGYGDYAHDGTFIQPCAGVVGLGAIVSVVAITALVRLVAQFGKITLRCHAGLLAR